MSIIEIHNTNINYISLFLKNDFPSSFRYFNNKTPEQIVKNHYKTIMYVEDGIPIGYAHIDYDIINNKYWFGICVVSEYQGRGIGKKLINTIINYFNNSSIDRLYLTVDKTNTVAYNMYLKYGFKVERETVNIYIMSLNKSNLLYLPVSYGEAIDKLTILDIKMSKINDLRRIDVETEFNTLFSQLESIIKPINFYYEALKQINLQIWEDQYSFRYSLDDNQKNQLCKKIIEDNDARFRIKNKINNILNSFLKEQKGYLPKIAKIFYSSDLANHKLLNSIIKYYSIFNDKITVECYKSQYQSICNIFKYDSSIEILAVLENEPGIEYLQELEKSINNKPFFEFIYRNT